MRGLQPTKIEKVIDTPRFPVKPIKMFVILQNSHCISPFQKIDQSGAGSIKNIIGNDRAVSKKRDIVCKITVQPAAARLKPLLRN
jgi:hypothetical protein